MSRKNSLLIISCGYLITFAFVFALFSLLYPTLNILYAVFLLDIIATLLIFTGSYLFNNSSFYDPYWSLAPLPILLTWYLHPENANVDPYRPVIILSLLFIWASRLTFNWMHRWKGIKDEDWRYTAFRSSSKPLYWLISLTGFHIFPTIVVFAGCLSTYPALCISSEPPGIADAIALIVALSGIAIEAIADKQLDLFRQKKNKEAFLASGLWKYARHPNYFGEILFWTGLFVFSLQADAFFWYTVIGPLAMILMFTFISTPMMDNRLKKHKTGYTEYMKKTSALIPLPPKPWF